MIAEAAALDDAGTNPERAAGMANMAKYVAVEAAIEACLPVSPDLRWRGLCPGVPSRALVA